jgi:hypothetical protein
MGFLRDRDNDGSANLSDDHAGECYSFKSATKGFAKFTSGFIIAWGWHDCDEGHHHEILLPTGCDFVGIYSILCNAVNVDDGMGLPFGDLNGTPNIQIDHTSYGQGLSPLSFKIYTWETNGLNYTAGPIGRVSYIVFGFHHPAEAGVLG